MTKKKQRMIQNNCNAPCNHETHPIALKPRKDWTEDEKKQYKLD